MDANRELNEIRCLLERIAKAQECQQKSLSRPQPIVNVGEYQFESIDSRIIYNPVQLRTAAPGEMRVWPIYVVRPGKTIRLDKFYWDVFTAQAAQDLRIRFYVGVNFDLYSGKFDSPETQAPFSEPDWVSETGITPTPGAPYTPISNLGGIGFHDNFPPKKDEWQHFYAQGWEGDTVALVVTNQSTLHTHSFFFGAYAWTWPSQTRNKKDLMKVGNL
jgi:hypothetical protein